MAIGPVSGQGRQLRFAWAPSRARSRYRYHASILYRWRYAGAIAERLLIAPIDLRTADPTVALDIYAGRFVFSGNGVDADGCSVFDVDAAERGMGARSCTVSAGSATCAPPTWRSSRSNAREPRRRMDPLSGRADPVAWEPDVVARRVIAWLSQTPLILEGCDLTFYRRFMGRSPGRSAISAAPPMTAPPGLPRLRVMIALAAAGAVDVRPAALPQAGDRAGSTSSWSARSCPTAAMSAATRGAILELLIDLLPLRQAFTARGTQPSRILLSAIDRMMPMLRFFRQGDGSFAHFNGMRRHRRRPARDRARL